MMSSMFGEHMLTKRYRDREITIRVFTVEGETTDQKFGSVSSRRSYGIWIDGVKLPERHLQGEAVTSTEQALGLARLYIDGQMRRTDQAN